MKKDTTPIVDAIAEMNFAGNIIAEHWYKTIVMPPPIGKDGNPKPQPVDKHGNPKPLKPDLIAIIILAEIVYWYRPSVIRDETTGQIIAIKKRFKADLLQRSYQSLADKFGITKRQARDAIDRLVALGIISKHLRTITLPDGRQMNNVLYLGLDPMTLKRHTYDVQTSQGVHSNAIGSDGETSQQVHSNVTPMTPERHTNTENTTGTTTKTTIQREGGGKSAKKTNGGSKKKSPPSPPEKIRDELKSSQNQKNLELAAAIADACGLNPDILAKQARRNGKPTKWEECLDHAAKLADISIPQRWSENITEITPALLAKFSDWWQSEKPIGNAETDYPHPLQVGHYAAGKAFILYADTAAVDQVPMFDYTPDPAEIERRERLAAEARELLPAFLSEHADQITPGQHLPIDFAIPWVRQQKGMGPEEFDIFSIDVGQAIVHLIHEGAV